MHHQKKLVVGTSVNHLGSSSVYLDSLRYVYSSKIEEDKFLNCEMTGP